MTELNPEQADQAVVAESMAMVNQYVDRVLVLMRSCPYSEIEQRWSSCIGLLEKFLRNQDSITLVAAAALERLSRVPVEAPK